MKLTAPPTQRTEPGINSVASARRGTLRLTKTRSIRTDSDAPALDHPENDALEVFSSRSRMVLPFNFLVALVWVLTLGGPAQAADRQWLHSHVPEAVPRLQRIARPSPLDRLNLAIALPLRNRDALTRLLQQISNPASPQFRHYLTPEQFTEQFGPTKEDYASVIAFAIAHGLALTGTHANRQLVDVEGAVSDVEATLHLHLGIYSHPLEVRTFYAPDLDPSLDLQVPVLEINGLNNYTTPRPRSRRLPPTPSGPTITSHAGSGPNGNYLGNDFRLAYVPGISLTGAGQTVGLFELDGYFTSDITAYKQLAKLPNIPLQNVLVDGFNGIPTSRKSGSGNEEVALDIEMAMSIAPGLARVIVYEGSPNATTANINNLLNRMATDNLAKQLSCSWGFDISAATQQIFQQFAAQGQTFFLASGDNGAFFGAIDQPSDDPYITTVGGTVLTTTSTHLWQTETAWNGSGGGISTIYPIPEWQQSIDLTGNLGSSTIPRRGKKSKSR